MMNRKFIALVVCSLFLPQSFMFSPLASASEPNYLFEVDFSDYANGASISEIETALKEKYNNPGTILPAAITSNNELGNLRFEVNNGMLEVSTTAPLDPSTSIPPLNFEVGFLNLVGSGIYVESEFMMVGNKGLQYILNSGSDQIFCGNITSDRNMSVNIETRPPIASAAISPPVFTEKNKLQTFRHLLNINANRFDGLWINNNETGLSQITIGGSKIIPYRYARLDTVYPAPVLTSLRFGGANAGWASQTGDILYKIKNIRIWESEEAYLARAAEHLTSDLLNVPPSGIITDNLPALPTSIPGFDGVNISSWSSNSPIVDAVSGNVTLPPDNTEVILMATLEFGDAEPIEKNFPLMVCGIDAQEYIVLHETFSSTFSLSQCEVISVGGTVTANNGLTMEKNNDTKLLTITRPFEKAETSLLRLGGEVTVELEWAAADENEDASAVFKSANGDVLSTAQFRKNEINGYDLTYSYLPDLNTMEEYAHNAISGEGTVVNSKFQFNLNTGAVDFWFNDIKNPEQTVYAVNPAGDINSVTFSVGSANSNEGTLKVKKLKVSMPNEKRLQMNADQLTWEMIAPGQTTDAVSFLNLPKTGTAGVKIDWVSSDPSVVTNDGAVIRKDTDKSVALTATLSKKEKPSDVLVMTPFEFTVPAIDLSNLAYQKPVSGNIVAGAGSVLSNLTDGSMATTFCSGGTEKGGFIQIDLGSIQSLSGLKLYENKKDGSYKIQDYTIQVSENGRCWNYVSTGTGIGEHKSIEFDPVKARYVRFSIINKASGPFELSEIEAYFNSSDEDIVSADKKWLAEIVNELPYIVVSNLSLPAVGRFGSEITWVSDNPGVIADDGSFIRRPAKDTSILLTATIKYGNATLTLKSHHMVEGTSSNTSLAGGGGTSSRIMIGTAPVAISHKDPLTDTGIFKDLDDVPQVVEAIEALYAHGVINGDGNGNFYPKRQVSREEFVKMLILTLDIPLPEKPSVPFTDCAPEGWYYGYMAAAFENGLVNGIEPDFFGLGRSVSRQDMVLMLYRALEKRAMLTELKTKEKQAFADADEISSYAANAVEVLWQADVLSADEDNRFRPLDDAIRSEAAMILYTLIK